MLAANENQNLQTYKRFFGKEISSLLGLILKLSKYSLFIAFQIDPKAILTPLSFLQNHSQNLNYNQIQTIPQNQNPIYKSKPKSESSPPE